MSGITTGVGIFSGIDTTALINQILQIESRPTLLAQRRLIELQTQQAAFLDINTTLSAIQNAASNFRNNNIFDTRSATSSDENVLTATASTSAIPGTYNFLVDRLVSSQQALSRGFVDSDSSPIGMDSITFEDSRARLDRDTALSLLNDGDGIDRGSIRLTVDGSDTTIDLSRASSLNEVLDAINTSDAGVTATVSEGSIVLDAGSGTINSVESIGGATTAEDLGIAGSPGASTLTGSSVYGLNANTSLDSINDGVGISRNDAIGEGRHDFVIDVDGTLVEVNLGSVFALQDDDGDGTEELVTTEARVTTVSGALSRINQALSDQGFGDVVASVDASNGTFSLANASGRTIEISENGSTTAQDLGFAVGSSTSATSITGDRVLAGLNTTLISSLNGGSTDTLGNLNIVARDGGLFNIDLSGVTTVNGLSEAIDAATGGDITVSLNSEGNGLLLTDNTGGSGNLVVGSFDSTAADLGLTTDILGIASNTLESESLQLRYIGAGTQLSDLAPGLNIGSGEVRFTDSLGTSFTVNISSDAGTLQDVIEAINNASGQASAQIEARINDNGDGLLITEADGSSAGSVKLKVEDVSGTVAADLRIEGESASSDAGQNLIDGSFEFTIDFNPTDTLDDVARAINESGVAVAASVINDGAGGNSFRLSLVSERGGVEGRFITDTNGFDLGLNTLDQGNDARIFFGSDNPADGVLIQSSNNSVEGIVPGVSIDLNSTSDELVTLNVTTNTSTIEQSVNDLLSAFNTAIDRIDFQTRFVEETEERGALLGDGTTIALRSALFSQVLGSNDGFSTGFNNFGSVGITVGTGGQLQLDSEKFREALAQDPDAVEDLFTRRTIDPDSGSVTLDDGTVVTDPDAETSFTELGLAVALEEFIDDYVNSISGVLTRKRDSIDTQIGLQEDRITSLGERLDNRRGILERQFAAMERAIAELQTASQSLGSISALGG